MADEKPSFIKIAPGAKVDGFKLLNNTFVGDADVINNEGELNNAVIDGNNHIVPPAPNGNPQSDKEPKKFDWTKWGTIATIIFGLLGILFFFLQQSTPQQKVTESPGSINTVNQSGGTNIISDAQAVQQVEYLYISKLMAQGQEYIAQPPLEYHSPLSDLLKPFVSIVLITGRIQITFECTQEALSAYKKIIKDVPKFPFSYFYLGACQKKTSNPDWKGNIKTAQDILNITTSIAGHDESHDAVLKQIKEGFN